MSTFSSRTVIKEVLHKVDMMKFQRCFFTFAVAVIPMVEAAAAIEVAASTGVFKYGSQLAKRGLGKVLSSWDRARGLSLLKKLPTGLEALVFGEDGVTPELLAALSLGGKPGIQLSMIAFLKSDYLRDFLFPNIPPEGAEGEEKEYGWFVESVHGETYLTRFFETGSDHSSRCSQMDDLAHHFLLFDGGGGEVRLPRPDGLVSLGRNAHVRVVGFVGLGLHATYHTLGSRRDSRESNEVFGPLVEADGCVYYCENLRGQLNVCEVDLHMRIPDSPGQHDFIVTQGVLESYSDFRRLMYVMTLPLHLTVKLLGLAKVGKELGEEFASQITGGGIPLLSFQHLQNVRNNPTRCSPALTMPTKEEVQRRVEEAMERMTLLERDVEVVLFSSMQEIISDFVINVESEAGRPGNVGVQPYKRKKGSNLIQSCIVQAVGMDATFAIFDRFRKHRLNIAVSPGATAMSLPALALTVVFPEGFEVQHRKTVLRPACPFSSDLVESLPILIGLAPKLAKHSCTEFAKALSLELAKDPALALSPVTFEVARALSPRGRAHDAQYLTDLFGHLKQWGEASVAGVLCQLGMTFSMPPRGEIHEVEGFRCFFQVCREIWPKTCSGAELVVDCAVDISGCLSRVRHKLFLVPTTMSNSSYKLIGEVADAWEKHTFSEFRSRMRELRECVGFLEGPIKRASGSGIPTPIPVPCRVIGLREPREESVEESKTG